MKCHETRQAVSTFAKRSRLSMEPGSSMFWRTESCRNLSRSSWPLTDLAELQLTTGPKTSRQQKRAGEDSPSTFTDHWCSMWTISSFVLWAQSTIQDYIRAEHKLHSISKSFISQVIIPQVMFFFSLFIFCGHSTWEPASSRVTYFILRAFTGTGFEKMLVNRLEG